MIKDIFTWIIMITLCFNMGCYELEIEAGCDPAQVEGCECQDEQGQVCDPTQSDACLCVLNMNAYELFGDTGRPCQPDQPNECNFYCLPLSSGEGTCVNLCEEGALVCPDQFKCNLIFDGVASWAKVCMPNTSCGTLMVTESVCEGGVVKSCEVDGLYETSCQVSSPGLPEPPQCTEFREGYGYDCLLGELSVEGGCEGESLSGRCEGESVVYCESLASGVIKREDCASGEECYLTEEGKAKCRLIGSQGCGDTTYQGYCDGTTAVWCQTDRSEIDRYDCSSEGKICGWVNDMDGYRCVISNMMSGNEMLGDEVVFGRVLYQKPAITSSGLGARSSTPVRQALIQLRRASNDQTIASQLTDQDGRFQLGYGDTEEMIYLAVFASAESERYSLSVRDCPLENCGGVGNIYGVSSENFLPESRVDFGDILIPDEIAGAFNIFDVFVQGSDFAIENLGNQTPSVIAQWAAGSNTSCGTSCFSSYNGNVVYILGTPQDTDEFDDSVLGHEFGHFLESAFSKADSPGGAHDGSPTDPRLAWSEGYGTYIGGAIFNNSVYIDTFASGTSVINIDRSSINANPGDSRGMRQLMSEYTISEILWVIGFGGSGTPPLENHRIFDVLGNYFTGALVDRGVIGVELVDFLDGWFCRGHGLRDEIYKIVTTDRGFPYDYNGPQECR